MDFDSPKFAPSKLIKTYSKIIKNPVKTVETVENVTDLDINATSSSKLSEKLPEDVKELTTKDAVSYLLSGTLSSKVCRYCLDVTDKLYELERVTEIANKKGIYSITLKEIIASFYPVQVNGDPNLPNKICDTCTDRAIEAYLFMQQCDQVERAVSNCFEDINTKFYKLDPVDGPTKKRGRKKINLNHNVIEADHAKVIEYADPVMHLINSGSESFTNVPSLDPLECSKCCQILPSIESLANHVKTHPKNMWFNCRLCGQSFAKRYLWTRHQRKHLRLPILASDKSKNDDEKFECKQCGQQNETYYNHLQHIEKHKFKMVMEHLIERKMDKLCSICLEKGKLEPLERMISFNGGPPDLMGDRTTRSILASVLPEQKKYKYQELHVANYAKIISFKKRKIDKGMKYNFSNPVIVDHKIDFIDESEDIFNFSAPVTVNDKLIVTETVNTETMLTDDLCDDTSATTMIIDEKDEVFVFSDPIVIEEAKDTEIIEPLINASPDAKDKMCIEDMFSKEPTRNAKREIELYDDTLIATCNEKSTSSNTEIIQDSARNVVQTVTKKNTGQETFAINKRPYEKISSKFIDCRNDKMIRNDSSEDTAKHTEWLCKTCLTENVDRELCLCCEARNPMLFSKTVKYNLKYNRAYICDINKRSDYTLESNNANIDIDNKTSESKIDIPKTLFQDNTENTLQTTIEVDDEKPIDIGVEKYPIDNKTFEIEVMDVDETPQGCANLNIRPTYWNSSGLVTPLPTDSVTMSEIVNTPLFTDTALKSSPFQFNIGCGGVPRKNVRPKKITRR